MQEHVIACWEESKNLSWRGDCAVSTDIIATRKHYTSFIKHQRTTAHHPSALTQQYKADNSPRCLLHTFPADY